MTEPLFVIEVMQDTPHMDGKRPWVTTTNPMTGWDAAQAMAGIVRRHKQGHRDIEDYRIVLHEGCSFDCDVCDE